MIKLIIVMAACGVLSACTTAHPMILPDGTTGQVIGCGGVQHSMMDCYEKAGKMCKAGYDVISGGEEYGVNSRMATLGGTNVGAIDRTLIVKCH